MFPFLAMNNLRNGLWGEAKLQSNVFLPCPTRSEFAYLDNLFWGKFRTGGAVPALVRHIAHVVRLCTKPEMGWIDTKWVIARVAHAHADSGFAMCQFPTNPRGILSVEERAPIADSAPPDPTFIWSRLVNLLPKPILDWASASVTDNIAIWAASDMAPPGVSYLRQLCLLSATAVAISVRGFVRGMIGHVASPFLTIGHATERISAAVALLLRNYTCSIPQNGGVAYYRIMTGVYQ